MRSSARSQHSEACGPMSAFSPDDRLRSPEEEELSQLERMRDGVYSLGTANTAGKRDAKPALKKSIYDDDAELDK